MGYIHSRRWGGRLQSCLDGEATPARMAIVQQHLRECAECNGEMEMLACVKRALARLGHGDSADPAVSRLQAHATRFTA